MNRRHVLSGFILASCVLLTYMLVPTSRANDSLDSQLRVIVDQHGLTPLAPPPAQPSAKVELGRMLFFDKVLSGNRDISCATCHHPTLGTGDNLPVSIGTGGVGLGSGRVIGEGREFIPRNAPEIFDRGDPAWFSMFWDGRIIRHTDGSFSTPAGAQFPAGVETLLAAQALFPITSRDEMRGLSGDLDVFGQPNEIAEIADDNFAAMWDAVMQRVLAIPEYRAMFAAAYPDVPADQMGSAQYANAVGAFEADAFTFTRSAWDRYLANDDAALSDAAKRGALLFFGEAGCATCHAGNLFTDQQFYNLGVPQLGPGKGDDAPLDRGRFRETGEESDRYAFRTPPLRNVELSGPYMHNGAFSTLEAAVRHHFDPQTSLRTYDASAHLPATLEDTCQTDPSLLDEVLATVDITSTLELDDAQVNDLLAFLGALTDPAARNIASIQPETVPSGLPVSDIPQTVRRLYMPLVVR